MANNSSVVQDIEALKKRHKELDRQKTTAEANFKTAEGQLKKIKDEAKKKFGTDDLAELKAALEKMTKDNERKRVEYQKHLNEIENKLKEIEEQYEEQE